MRSFLLFTAVLVLAAACNGDSGDAVPTSVISTLTRTPTPNPTIVTATDTPAPTATSTSSATDTPTATPSPPPPTSTATATPAGTATPQATASPSGDSTAGDVEGFPFSTADIRATVEARGFSFLLLTDRGALCGGATVEVHSFWSANLAGSDSGPALAVWVYPDRDALEADWSVATGSAPEPRFGCELPTGFVYWNENLVMALDTWLAAGSEVAIGNESPSQHPAIEGFLSLLR
jgi:hypothetical protein